LIIHQHVQKPNQQFKNSHVVRFGIVILSLMVFSIVSACAPGQEKQVAQHASTRSTSAAQVVTAHRLILASVQQVAVPVAPVSQINRSSSSVAGMISQVFGPYAGSAINVATCESGLNPAAVNASSGAAGVFQILPSTFSSTSMAGSSPLDAYANVVAAHEIFMRDGYSWREWVCQ
jgi:Transglycosylase SLT domain